MIKIVLCAAGSNLQGYILLEVALELTKLHLFFLFQNVSTNLLINRL